MAAIAKEEMTSFQVGQGDVFHLTKDELSKIPFLESLAFGHSQGSVIKVDESPSLNSTLLKVVLTYVKRKRAKILFSHLPEGHTPSEMLTLLDYLLIQKPTGTVQEYSERMKNVRTDYDEFGRNGSANRPGARDAIVQLCWSLNNQVILDQAMEQRIYNLILFGVSHPRTYYPLRLRENVFQWYKDWKAKRNCSVTWKAEQKLQEFLTQFQDRSDSETSSGGTSEENSYNSDSYDYNSD